MPRLAPWTLLLLAAGFASCQATPPAATKTLSEAAAKYNNRQIEDAEAIADKYITSNSAGPEIAEAYYLRGLCRFTRGSRPLAALDLKQALSRTTRTDLKTKAHRALGDIEFETQDWPAAQTDYEAALASGGLNGEALTTVDYRVGITLQSQGQWQKAQPWFGRVVAANPEPALKDRAVARMYATHFSLQFGAFHDASSARDLITQLKPAGISASLESELREGQFLYLVRSGAYTTWPLAAVARDQWIAKYPLVTIIP